MKIVTILRLLRSWVGVTQVIFGFTLIIGCSSSNLDTLPPAKYQDYTSSYIIAAGDKLRVFVWDLPQLSVDVTVRPDGKVTTPLVEDIQASGKTANELAREIEKLLARYVINPVVSVQIQEFIGRYSEQIRVIGQATKPRSLPYREKITLLDVMIAVGGLTEFADGNKATIVRTVSGKQKAFQVKLDDLIRDGDISANVDMLPGDVLTIPEAWF